MECLVDPLDLPSIINLVWFHIMCGVCISLPRQFIYLLCSLITLIILNLCILYLQSYTYEQYFLKNNKCLFFFCGLQNTVSLPPKCTPLSVPATCSWKKSTPILLCQMCQPQLPSEFNWCKKNCYDKTLENCYLNNHKGDL